MELVVTVFDKPIERKPFTDFAEAYIWARKQYQECDGTIQVEISNADSGNTLCMLPNYDLTYYSDAEIVALVPEKRAWMGW